LTRALQEKIERRQLLLDRSGRQEFLGSGRNLITTTDKQAQDLAQLRLKTNPDNPNALFARTLSLGMQADHASLIEQASARQPEKDPGS
jgi:hypothetical protein